MVEQLQSVDYDEKPWLPQTFANDDSFAVGGMLSSLNLFSQRT
jgi:hypothetical protein